MAYKDWREVDFTWKEITEIQEQEILFLNQCLDAKEMLINGYEKRLGIHHAHMKIVHRKKKVV